VGFLYADRPLDPSFHPAAVDAGLGRGLRAGARVGSLGGAVHSAAFWELVHRYPKSERAEGYLEGISAAANLRLDDF